MIKNNYRPNVGMIICNKKYQIFWAKRYKQNSWQFPQGGINFKESPVEAMYRELSEEVGLKNKDVKILTFTKKWLYYKIPQNIYKKKHNTKYIGQKQRWFLLKLVGNELNININNNKKPEFDKWRWVSYWYPIRKIIYFKRDIYRTIMKKFAPFILSKK